MPFERRWQVRQGVGGGPLAQLLEGLLYFPFKNKVLHMREFGMGLALGGAVGLFVGLVVGMWVML